MYGVDMSKKENRIKAREILYYKEGMTIIDRPDIEFMAYTSENPPTLTAFRGTAGKPYIYYKYRTAERRDDELQKAIESQEKRLEYKAQRKTENKGKLTGSAATAAEIRKRLKTEFPGVKFSVKSSTYSMGDSVRVSWTDGPFYDQVYAIARQYQHGSFDGMTDCYNYRDINPSLDCPGAKYVSCDRKLSPEYELQIREILERDFIQHNPYSYAPFQWTQAEKILLGIQDPEPEPEQIPEPEQKQPRNNYALDCGCTVHYKADIHTCQKCKKQLCDKHAFFYVDESNEAITKHSPLLCRECYESKHGAQCKPERPAAGNVIDFTAKLKERQQQADTEQAIGRFTADYLPHFQENDFKQIMAATDDQQTIILAKICMRIDLERGRG